METRDANVFNEYKRVRNLVRTESRNRAIKYQLEIARACKRNPKRFWQYVKSKTTTSTSISDLLIKEGAVSRIVSDDLEKSELFSKSFSSIYTVESDTPYNKLPDVMPHNTMPRITVTDEMVADKLTHLKLDKSPGPDMLHPRVLYEISHIIVPYLRHVFNNSLNQAIVPDDWKHSTITALHKKGKKDNVENYRPISLTCITCKIMESIICDHITSYLKSNHLLSDKQYGFIKNRST
jgi:hypothetical protein